MTTFQLISTVIIYIWLFLVLWLLWRHAIGGSAHVRRLQTMLNENARKSAEAAQKAADVVYILAKLLEEKHHEHGE